jgi:TonB family protein
MRRDDVILTVALCLSLLAHGLLAFVGFHIYANRAGRIALAGFDRQQPQLTVQVDPDSIFGDADGAGASANRFAADQVLLGRQAPDPQALLSRDPAGAGKIGDSPSMSLLPPANEMDDQPPPAVARPMAASKTPPSLLTIAPEKPLGAALSVTDFSAPAWPKPEVPPKAAAIVSKSAARAADPAPMSDSESDPFTRTGTVEISAGNIEAKLGRKVKTVRPHLSVASYETLVGILDRRMRLRVRIDEHGKVMRVDILRSSGSSTADQETKLAVYQWTFDPRPDRAAVGDYVEFDIVWR